MKKYAFMLANCSCFLVLYLVSWYFLQDVYLPDWTRRNAYLCVWIAPIVFDFLELHIRSVCITLGNLVGVVVGQIAGDIIVKLNAAKITPATPPGQAAQLRSHPGFFLWLGTILVFYIAGVLIEKKRKAAGTKS